MAPPPAAAAPPPSSAWRALERYSGTVVSRSASSRTYIALPTLRSPGSTAKSLEDSLWSPHSPRPPDPLESLEISADPHDALYFHRFILSVPA